tara:strand:+ start:573 stop:1409 length:837 start_codon:yes stop_codon:yes gene_type:complete
VKNRLLKISLIGKTNSGKSTFLNLVVGEQISIINRKVNTTQDIIKGIVNFNETQLIFFDSPGTNAKKEKEIKNKKFQTHLYEVIDNTDLIMYFIDSNLKKFDHILSEIKKISETKKKILIIFNKIDLINPRKILFLVKILKSYEYIDAFFYISAKYNKGIKDLKKYLISSSILSKWIYSDNEISNKDDIFITSECTRNAVLTYIHKEIPYNVIIKNDCFKTLKNGDKKIKQSIKIKNPRYKSILLGKNGQTIKKIRVKSQNEISKIFNSKVHLYLKVI